MICPPCADAGRHNTEARRLAALGLSADANQEYFTARQHHRECLNGMDSTGRPKRGTWCDCHHDVTGNALNPMARVNRAAAASKD